MARNLYNPSRSHPGFCSESMTYSVTGGEPPNQFEVVSCGCEPSGAAINIGHPYVIAAARSGKPFSVTAAALVESKAGTVNKLAALRTAVISMKAKGLLNGVDLPGDWP